MGEVARVLHVLHSVNRGGTEAMIMNYYRSIDKSKVQFDFLLTEQKECEYEQEIISLGGRIYRVTPLKLTTLYKYIKEIDNFFKAHKGYKIIHSHTSSKSFFPLWIAKKHYIPVRISHSHGSKSETGLKGKIRDLLKIPLKNVSTNYFACGELAAIWLYGEKLWQNNSVEVVKNAINISEYTYNHTSRIKVRTQLGLEDKFVVGHVGRIEQPKNHEFLVDVFREIYLQNHNAVLLLVGDGSLRTKIEQKVSEYGLKNNVIFLGVRSDVTDLLQAMDVFVFPSLFEGLGIGLIESQAAGLKTFASADVIPNEVRVTDLLEFIPLDNSSKQWANVILRSGKNNIRRDTRKDLKKAGYDINEASKWLENFYLKSILNK